MTQEEKAESVLSTERHSLDQAGKRSLFSSEIEENEFTVIDQVNKDDRLLVFLWKEELHKNGRIKELRCIWISFWIPTEVKPRLLDAHYKKHSMENIA